MIKQKEDKKAQAALEFLMTYGWAILAAIIAIGILAYMGVFSPKPSNSVLISSPLYAESWQFNNGAGANDDEIAIEIRNNAGININDVTGTITVTSVAGGVSCPCTDVTQGGGTNPDVADGQTDVLYCTCAADIGGQGARVKGDISISYLKLDSGLPQRSTGTVLGALS